LVQHIAKLFLPIITILISAGACQTTSVPPAVTLTAAPTETPRPAVTLRPTLTPRLIATHTPIPMDSPPPTDTPLVINSPAPQVGLIDPPIGSAPLDDTIVVGTSVEGRAIVAHSFGTGEQVIVLVGGIHGGWEANTVTLVEALIDHFRETPEDVLAGIRLLLIPAANPDGLLHGRTAQGRLNADGVDLNRNWGCGWSPEAVWRRTPVSPGTNAFSEPETLALASFLRELRPVVALFYHSAAAGIYTGDCGGPSESIAPVLGEATGYPHGRAFSAYPVSGTAASWADGQGIASADVELQSSTASEFERNLRGIMALQAWLLEQTAN
jgi:hypothetical protein